MKNRSILKTPKMNCTSLAGETFPAFFFFFFFFFFIFFFFKSNCVILSFQYLGYFSIPKLDVLIRFGSEFDVISDGCLCYSRRP